MKATVTPTYNAYKDPDPSLSKTKSLTFSPIPKLIA